MESLVSSLLHLFKIPQCFPALWLSPSPSHPLAKTRALVSLLCHAYPIIMSLMRHQVVKGQREREREKKGLELILNSRDHRPHSQALFLTILYACPEATAVTLHGTVGLPEVSTERMERGF